MQGSSWDLLRGVHPHTVHEVAFARLLSQVGVKEAHGLLQSPIGDLGTSIDTKTFPTLRVHSSVWPWPPCGVRAPCGVGALSPVRHSCPLTSTGFPQTLGSAFLTQFACRALVEAGALVYISGNGWPGSHLHTKLSLSLCYWPGPQQVLRYEDRSQSRLRAGLGGWDEAVSVMIISALGSLRQGGCAGLNRQARARQGRVKAKGHGKKQEIRESQNKKAGSLKEAIPTESKPHQMHRAQLTRPLKPHPGPAAGDVLSRGALEMQVMVPAVQLWTSGSFPELSSLTRGRWPQAPPGACHLSAICTCWQEGRGQGIACGTCVPDQRALSLLAMSSLGE